MDLYFTRCWFSPATLGAVCPRDPEFCRFFVRAFRGAFYLLLKSDSFRCLFGIISVKLVENLFPTRKPEFTWAVVAMDQLVQDFKFQSRSWVFEFECFNEINNYFSSNLDETGVPTRSGTGGNRLILWLFSLTILSHPNRHTADSQANLDFVLGLLLALLALFPFFFIIMNLILM